MFKDLFIKFYIFGFISGISFIFISLIIILFIYDLRKFIINKKVSRETERRKNDK